MSTYIHVMVTFLIAATVAFAAGDPKPLPFEAAIEAHEQGDYAAAKTKFLAALEINETAAARHNLGLTELQLDHPAEAVWQLERGLILDPFNRDYRNKLSLVRKQLGLTASTQEWHLLFSQIVSLNVWTIVATISFWLLLAAWILPKLSGKKASTRIHLIRLFNSLALVLSLTAIWLNLKDLKTGIVLAEETTALHAAPATAAPEIGFARPGERAHVLDQHNDFYQVKTEGSATGWISNNDFRLVHDTTVSP